jgi:subtilisin family serine protease
MRHKQRWLAGGLAAALALGVTVAATASDAATTPPPATTQPPGTDPARTVTLISGDKVQVAAGGDAVHVTPGPGRAGMRFVQQRGDGHHLVVPVDALAPLGRGLLDRRLFDVTRLLDDGYDDRARSTLPVLMRSTARLTAFGAARRLRGYDMTAVAVRKDATGDLWSKLASGPRATAAGIGKVWLDAKLRPTLDRSVPQIGAPAAWAAGLTGTGVKVAVLDSGYDPTHPDLAGLVAESRNFTSEPDIVDHVGHGTHVASTIAGSGAASGGKYKGVAPGAKLLVGKVCETFGCSESAILDGMRWAAESGARVVNMSLGGEDQPGVDPVEEAVNTLTASTGTLFVIAAGNSGPDGATVGSPGSADAALTVGAVDRADALALFSSRGPRVGDKAVKPDLTAPGVGIVAARAAGTGEGADGQYTTMSGTSMATPHVAGAAAIVAQQHPDWKAGQIKEALVHSAKPTAGSVFDAGAGRVDVARVITQPVYASPASLSFGLSRWPHTDDKPETKTLTFRNTSAAPVTLTLTLAATGPGGQAAPAGMFTAPATTTVPVNGTSTVDVTVNTKVAAPDGLYSAVLTATGGGVTLRTAIGVDREPESYDQTVTILDRAGTPVDTNLLSFVGLDTPARVDATTVNGKATARLPKGRWTVMVPITDNDETGPDGRPNATVIAVPDVMVDRNGSLVLDGRKGQPVDVSVPHKDARLASAEVVAGQAVGGGGLVISVDAPTGPDRDHLTGVYAVPTTARHAPDFVFDTTTTWARPNGDGFTDSPYQYHLVAPTFGGIPAKPTHAFTARELATVRSDLGATVPGSKVRLVAWPTIGGLEGGLFGVVPLTAPRPLTRYFSTAGDVRWTSDFYEGDFRLSDRPRAYQAGHASADRWNQPVYGPGFPDWQVARFPFVGRAQNQLRAALPLLSDGSADRYGSGPVRSGGADLYRDGVKIGTSPDPMSSRFEVPTAAGSYRLVATATRDAAFSSTVTGEWTFTSARPDGDRYVALPLSAVRYLPALDGAGRAPAGPYRIPLAVQSQVRTSVKSLTVDVSYDDGRTWQAATVRRDRDGWSAAVTHPATPGGWVSLRSRITDATGSTGTQTVIHAYQLR